VQHVKAKNVQNTNSVNNINNIKKVNYIIEETMQHKDLINDTTNVEMYVVNVCPQRTIYLSFPLLCFIYIYFFCKL